MAKRVSLGKTYGANVNAKAVDAPDVAARHAEDQEIAGRIAEYANAAVGTPEDTGALHAMLDEGLDPMEGSRERHVRELNELPAIKALRVRTQGQGNDVGRSQDDLGYGYSIERSIKP